MSARGRTGDSINSCGSFFEEKTKVWAEGNISDEEVKHQLATEKPWQTWLDKTQIVLEEGEQLERMTVDQEVGQTAERLAHIAAPKLAV